MLHVAKSNLVVRQPGVKSYVVVAPASDMTGAATFKCDQFEAVASIGLDGKAGDSGSGYRAGFTQLQWIETNRAYYRGQRDNDGSVQVLRDRPPARPAQACRDVASPTDPFTYPPGAQALVGYMPSFPLNIDLASVSAFPATIMLSHADSPLDFYPIKRINSMTRKPNFLQWAQLEFHFCTLLLIRRPDGSFHQLQHFYWNVHWTDNFDSVIGSGGQVASVTPRLHGAKNVMNFGPFIAGEVMDWRFKSLITSASTLTCNTVADQEEKAKIVLERRRW